MNSVRGRWLPYPPESVRAEWTPRYPPLIKFSFRIIREDTYFLLFKVSRHLFRERKIVDFYGILSSNFIPNVYFIG